MAFFGFLLNGRSLCEQLIHGALIEVQALAAQLQPFLVAEACAVDGALAGKLYRMIRVAGNKAKTQCGNEQMLDFFV